MKRPFNALEPKHRRRAVGRDVADMDGMVMQALQPNRTPMPKLPKKSDFPISQVRRYLEPGLIVLVSSKWQGATNI